MVDRQKKENSRVRPSKNNTAPLGSQGLMTIVKARIYREAREESKGMICYSGVRGVITKGLSGESTANTRLGV